MLGTISGFLVQALGIFRLELHHSEIRNIGITVFTLGILNELARSKPTQRSMSWRHQVLVLSPALLVAVLVISSRIFAHGQQRFALTNLNFFGGEDSAKWLNIVAQLVSDKSVDVGSVGGLCASYLSFVVAWVRTLSPMFGFVTTELSLLTSSTAVSELLLVILLPLGLLPMFSHACRRQDLLTAIPVQIVASIFLMSSSSQFLRLGQLSAQMVLLFGVVLVSRLSESDIRTTQDIEPMLVALILLTGLTSIWLPLQALTAFVSIIGGVFVVMHIRTGGALGTNAGLLIACVALVPGSILTSFDTLTYVTHSGGTLQNLFSAGGGTPVHTTFIIFLAMVLLSLFVLIQHLDSPTRTTPLSWVLPLATVPVIAIIMADYVRTGKVNYGSQKLTFMVLTIVVGGLLGPVVLGLAKHAVETTQRSLVLTCGAAVLLILTVDGSSLPWLEITRNSQWKSSQSVLDSGWARFTLVSNSTEQNISDLPIACGIVGKEDGGIGVDMNTYTCTRFLTAMTGLEKSAGPLVEWQLRGSWAESVVFLRRLPPEVQRRRIIRLDAEGRYVDVVTLGRLIEGD